MMRKNNREVQKYAKETRSRITGEKESTNGQETKAVGTLNPTTREFQEGRNRRNRRKSFSAHKKNDQEKKEPCAVNVSRKREGMEGRKENKPTRPITKPRETSKEIQSNKMGATSNDERLDKEQGGKKESTRRLGRAKTGRVPLCWVCLRWNECNGWQAGQARAKPNCEPRGCHNQTGSATDNP